MALTTEGLPPGVGGTQFMETSSTEANMNSTNDGEIPHISADAIAQRNNEVRNSIVSHVLLLDTELDLLIKYHLKCLC